MTGLFPHYMPKAALEELKNYKYKSGPSTWTDRVLDRFFWTPCAACLPTWVAPNVVTLLGFLASLVALLLVWFFSPGLMVPCPRWVSLSAAFLFFAHQTLDAIDGKQARRIGSSSPLGTLFDHGCDTLTGTFAFWCLYGALGSGHGALQYFTMCVSVQSLQFLYFWHEYHYGVFFSNPGNLTGVTEAQISLMSILAFVGIAGPAGLAAQLQSILPNALLTAIVPKVMWSFSLANAMLVILMLNNCHSLMRVLGRDVATLPKNRASVCLAQLSFHFLFIFAGWLFYREVLVLRSGMVFAGIVTLSCMHSTLTVRLLLASTCKRKYSIVQWPLLPFLATVVLLANTNVNARLLVTAHAIFQLVYLADLVLSSITDICETLGIYCFHLGRREKEA